jgi:signal transducing adaptor molecule
LGEGSATGAFSQYHSTSASASAPHSPSRGSRPGSFARTRSGLAHTSATATSSAAPDLGPSETGYARAIALFDLPAGADGDLALKKGQVVFAMDKVGAGGEWWRGMNVRGEAGIFPANYVEVLEIPQKLKGGLSRGELKRRVLDLELKL